jgi:hypothetical protein
MTPRSLSLPRHELPMPVVAAKEVAEVEAAGRSVATETAAHPITAAIRAANSTFSEIRLVGLFIVLLLVRTAGPFSMEPM